MLHAATLDMISSDPIHGLGLFAAMILILIAPYSHAAEAPDQTNYQDEYCYHESFNLGTCLGKQRIELLDYPQEKLLRCTECSGTFGGDETCDELKALNDVGQGTSDGGTTAGSINWDESFWAESINWDESFCEEYDRCVEENCPGQCRKEQDAWLECLIVELDCDWRCPGSTWAIDMGEGTGNVAAIVTNDGSQGVDVAVSTFGLRTWMAGLLLTGVLVQG